MVEHELPQCYRTKDERKLGMRVDEFSHLNEASNDGGPVAEYGQHTLQKLATVRYYLKAFNTACTRTRWFGGWTFVDTFAGSGLVQVRDTERFFEGSALIGLRSGASVVHAIEFQQAHVNALRQRAQDRGIDARLRTHPGDANKIAPQIVATIRPRTPVFVLQDPEGMELNWSTVEAVARANRGKRKRKPEQLINFTDGILRLFWMEQPLSEALVDRLDGYFGTEAWRDIVSDRRAGRLESRETIQAAVNLYKKRLRTDLGYAHVLDREIRRDQVTRGALAYHLVFASDHSDAPRIMQAAFKEVHVGQREFPGMPRASSDE